MSPGGPRSALVVNDFVLDLARSGALLPIARWIPTSTDTLIAGGAEGLDILRRIEDALRAAAQTLRDDMIETGVLTPLSSARLAAPVARPGILLSHARAYHSHLAEMEGAAPPPRYPAGFIKNVHAIVGPDAPIRLPRAAPSMVDFEGEVSIVFSRRCHGVSPAEALDHVLGVTIVNDMSARDWVEEMKTFPDRNRMGKQFPTFAPMGPWIVTLDDIADINDLHMTTRVNGEVMQDSRTSDLIWPLSDLISYYSHWYPFEPGDVLTTGSPAGVGYGRDPKRFLEPGDVVEITVDGVGTLSNPIAAES